MITISIVLGFFYAETGKKYLKGILNFRILKEWRELHLAPRAGLC
jgi:hypothetical protein